MVCSGLYSQHYISHPYTKYLKGILQSYSTRSQFQTYTQTTCAHILVRNVCAIAAHLLVIKHTRTLLRDRKPVGNVLVTSLRVIKPAELVKAEAAILRSLSWQDTTATFQILMFKMFIRVPVRCHYGNRPYAKWNKQRCSMMRLWKRKHLIEDYRCLVS